ncbi:hypothetical protein [Gordonia sp. CPCC 205333]|uniref:hypothetical protein n=1 Tax=Gordonia sp. CPCC 205333 TaxID=3140790 RepID=UPI003AF3873B
MDSDRPDEKPQADDTGTESVDRPESEVESGAAQQPAPWERAQTDDPEQVAQPEQSPTSGDPWATPSAYPHGQYGTGFQSPQVPQNPSAPQYFGDPQASDPQASDPQASDPQASDPQYGAVPQGGGEQYGYPQYGAPQHGYPQYGSSQYGAPQYGSPQYGEAQHVGAPQYGAAQPYGVLPPTPPAPAQMWLPSGANLTQSTWRKRWRIPVIVGSSIVGVVMAVVAVIAILAGSINGSVFTGKGIVVVACQSDSLLQAMIKPGTVVEIWAQDGTREGETRLGPKKAETSDDGRRVCYMTFEVDDVRADQAGYDIRVGPYTQFVTAQALKSRDGVVLRPF